MGEKSYAAAIELGQKELAKKEPPCRGHPSLAGFEEFKKIDKERCMILHDYVVNNREDFCKTCVG